MSLRDFHWATDKDVAQIDTEQKEALAKRQKATEEARKEVPKK